MRRFIVSTVILASLAAAPACGGSGVDLDESPLAQRLHKVAAITEKAKTAQTSATLDVEAKAEGKKPSKTTVLSEGVWSFEKNKGRQTLKIGPVNSELVVLGGVLYTKSPQPQDPARPWTKSPAKGAARLGTTDPQQTVSLLLGAREVKAGGTEEVRGESTDKYTFTIDIDAAASRLPEGESQAFEQSLKSLQRDELPATAWVDESGRLRRLRYTIATTAEKGSSKIVSTVELFDFGATVDVVAPPDSEITTTK